MKQLKKQAKKTKTKSKKIEDQSKEIKALTQKKDKVETGAPYPDETEKEDGGTK